MPRGKPARTKAAAFANRRTRSPPTSSASPPPDAPAARPDASRDPRHGRVDVRPLGFPVLDHVELAEQHDLIDFEAGARIAGHGFYFLKNEAALLELALQQYAIELLVGEGFTPTITPDLARGDA